MSSLKTWFCIASLITLREIKTDIIFLQNVMGERSRSAWNPLDPNTKGRTEVLSRILANTLEQFVLFFGATIGEK